MSLYRALIAFGLLASIAVYLDNDPNRFQPLSFATNHWLGYEPLYVTSDIGLIDEELLELYTLTSTTDVFRALRHGEIDGAALTLDEVLLLVSEGLPLTIIGVADVSDGADAVLLSNRHPVDADLNGMRIAYEGNVLGAFLVARLLELKGLTKDDVTLLVAEPHQHASLLADDKIDVSVTYEPFVSRLSSGTHVIFTSKDIPGEIVDVLAVVKDRATLPQMAHLLSIWRSGVEYIDDRNMQTLQNMSDRHNLSVGEIEQALETIAFPGASLGKNHVFLDSEQLYRTMRKVWGVMQNQGIVANMVSMPNVDINIEGVK